MKSLRILMVLAAVGCGDDDGGNTADAPTGGNPDAGGQTTELTAVANPTTIAAGGDVELTITPPTGFTLTDPGPAMNVNVEGEGHYHIYLDDATGGEYLVNDFVSPVTVTIPGDTAAGAHTLRVELEQNDHTPLNPAVETTVDITVQ